jgi:hypothetical protein
LPSNFPAFAASNNLENTENAIFIDTISLAISGGRRPLAIAAMLEGHSRARCEETRAPVCY